MNKKTTSDPLSKIIEGINQAKKNGVEKGKKSLSTINIVFDGPPGPVAGRFVEVENNEGEMINVGEWIDRKDGYWVLKIKELPSIPELQDK